MSLLVDAIAGWLTQAMGDASLRTGVRLTLGSHEERQLRAALELAVDRTVNQAPASCRAALKSALDENVTGTVAWAADQEGRLIDELRAAVRAEIAPLTDSSLTGHGRSFCEIIGISPGWLLRVLPEEVIRSVSRLAATRAGALAPLASQLNADATLEGLAAISHLLMETPAAASVRNLPPDVRAFTGRTPELVKIRGAPRARRGVSCRRNSLMRCCAEDEGFVALRSRPAGGGFKPPHAAVAEDCRGERCGKGAT
jgi:hypothetical protein